MVYQDITRNKDISAAAKGLYAYLSAFCGSSDECYPTVDTITKEMSMTKDTFYRHVNALVSAGVVEKRQTRVEGNKFGRTIYRVTHEVHISDFPFPKNSITESSISENSETNNNILNNNIIKQNNKKNNVVQSEIVDYLNQKTGKNFKSSTKKTQSCINARLKEGFSLDDFKTVIDRKVSEWAGTEMDQYLRPETLFGTKFEGYLNAVSTAAGFGKKSGQCTVEEQARLNRESYEQQEQEYQEWKRQHEEFKMLHQNDPVVEDPVWG